MDDRQRDELLAEVNRTSNTLGASIPETVGIDGETVPVREFYFDLSDREELDDATRKRVEEVLAYLRRRRLSLVQRIRDGEVDYETGQSLATEVPDLDRAINAFESLEDPDLSEQVRRERIESARELVDMLREVGKL